MIFSLNDGLQNLSLSIQRLSLVHVHFLFCAISLGERFQTFVILPWLAFILFFKVLFIHFLVFFTWVQRRIGFGNFNEELSGDCSQNN